MVGCSLTTVGNCGARKKRPAGQLVLRRPITGKPIAPGDPARQVADSKKLQLDSTEETSAARV